MAIRRVEYRPSMTTLAASTTYTWTESEIPTRGLRALLFSINQGSAGAGGDFFGATGVERIRVKVGGATIIDASYKTLRAWVKRFSYAQKDTMTGAATDRIFCLPFYFMDGQNQAEQDKCGFPPGAKITVEVVTGTAVLNSPTLTIGWILSDQPVEFYPMLLDNFLNYSASSGAQVTSLRQAGILRAIVIPTKGLSELVIRQSGLELWLVKGGNSSTQGELVAAAQMLEQGSYSYGEHHALRVDSGRAMPPGDSSLRITTGSDWQPSSPDNSYAVYSIVPVGVQV
jgi:hypothetical protein